MATFKEKNIEVLGVSFDTVEENRSFAEKFDFPFQLLCDTDRKLGMAYAAASDVSAKSAKRISYVVGPTGLVEQAHSNVDPRTHSADILAQLED